MDFASKIANATLNVVAGTAHVNNIRSDRGDWMGNSSDLRPLHLNEIAIPGTHNSGTRDFPGIGAAYSICQTADVRQQLDAGIRYLDFRVCDDVEGKNGELWVSHTFQASPLEPHLHKIKEFLDDHGREFIILQVKRDFNRKLSGGGLNKLNDLFSNIFGSALANGNDVRNKVFGDLVDSGKKLTIVGGVTLGCAGGDNAPYASSWDQTNADNVDALHEKLRNWASNDLFQHQGQGSLTNLECILTPSPESIGRRVWANLYEMTTPVHQMLCGEGGEWKAGTQPLLEEFKGRGFNIVSHDFVSDPMVDAILRTNRVQVQV